MSPIDLIAWAGAIALAVIFLSIASIVGLAAIGEIRKAALRRRAEKYRIQEPRIR